MMTLINSLDIYSNFSSNEYLAIFWWVTIVNEYLELTGNIPSHFREQQNTPLRLCASRSWKSPHHPLVEK